MTLKNNGGDKGDVGVTSLEVEDYDWRRERDNLKRKDQIVKTIHIDQYASDL